MVSTMGQCELDRVWVENVITCSLFVSSVDTSFSLAYYCVGISVTYKTIVLSLCIYSEKNNGWI